QRQILSLVLNTFIDFKGLFILIKFITIFGDLSWCSWANEDKLSSIGLAYFEHYREQLLILKTSHGLRFCLFLVIWTSYFGESSQNQCTGNDKQKYKNKDSILYRWHE
ncbi:unnamed protein product, partial [Meganyctiphanes norvegica]